MRPAGRRGFLQFQQLGSLQRAPHVRQARRLFCSAGLQSGECELQGSTAMTRMRGSHEVRAVVGMHTSSPYRPFSGAAALRNCASVCSIDARAGWSAGTPLVCDKPPKPDQILICPSALSEHQLKYRTVCFQPLAGPFSPGGGAASASGSRPCKRSRNRMMGVTVSPCRRTDISTINPTSPQSLSAPASSMWLRP